MTFQRLTSARRGLLGALLGALMLAAVPPLHAAPLPYDESADAKAEIRQALVSAQAAHVPLVIIFGANWCPDCRALDAALHTGRTAALMAQRFRVVKVDVGRFDHNLDVDAVYGHPIKGGIPAAVLVGDDGQVAFSTRGGQLSDARHMSETGIYDFFRQAADAHPGRPASAPAAGGH